jgi:hypothetical protein
LSLITQLLDASKQKQSGEDGATNLMNLVATIRDGFEQDYEEGMILLKEMGVLSWSRPKAAVLAAMPLSQRKPIARKNRCNLLRHLRLAQLAEDRRPGRPPSQQRATC